MSIELDDVTSGYNVSVINKNFQTIEDKMNDEILWRKASSVAGEAKMERDLDMDGHRILNADIDGSQITNDRAVRVSDMQLSPIPQSNEERKGKVVTFDINTGQPIAVAPASGSAVDVLNQLAAPDGYKLVPSVFNALSEIPVELFRTSGMTDQQVIVAADTFGAANDYSIVFQSGRTYQVTAVTNTCKWVGNGAILLRAPSTSSTLLTVTEDVTGLIVDGNRANAPGGSNTVYINNQSGIKFSTNTVRNATAHAIFITDGSDSSSKLVNTISDNICTNAVGSGIYMYDALSATVTGNKVYSCGGGILGQGTSRKASKIIVENNTINNNTGDGIVFGLITEAADQQAYERLKINSNNVYGNAQNGIACQADYCVINSNHVYSNGSETYHQGILVNANGVSVTDNVILNNAGVGIDLGDCRKVNVSSNIVEQNGWIGIEVNSCEQVTVTGNMLNLNFSGKSPADMQAAILLHKGDGGYPFLGDNKDITVTGNTIRGGDGQQYAILVNDINCYNITIIGNTCKSAAFAEDIVSRSPDVIIRNNFTRWDVGGAARATISSGIIPIPSVADVVYVNGTGSVITVNIKDSGSYIKDRTVRLVAVNGCTFENSGGSGGNLYLGSSQVIAAGRSIVLWSDGSGGWVKANT